MFASMADNLRQLFSKQQISSEWIDRITLAHDASLYRIVPQVVVRPDSVTEIQELFRYCRDHHRHLTFRAAGTSLSGQALSDDILVDLGRGWDSYKVLDNGERIQLGPGITGGRVNQLLQKYGTRIGPDPASIHAAKIGGIIANNASGMCCGTRQNSYNTLDSADVVLACGLHLNTGDVDADERFRQNAPQIYAGLIRLRDAIRANTSLAKTIERKYRIKNTMGYSLNAFLDEESPGKILARLLVGSEGTLGFIASVILRTVPDPKNKWTNFFLYPGVHQACEEAIRWQEMGAAAIELMDDASLKSFANIPSTPAKFRCTDKNVAALLIEFHDAEPDNPETWIVSEKEQHELWRLRRGLMPSIGAKRKSGETMINEDIAVPQAHLADLVLDVRECFRTFNYEKAIVFGHAKDGNIHFVVNDRFDSQASINRYDAFMHAVANVVVGKYSGSLKAEHGTGRNMAPFLEQEWGTDAVEVMQEIKTLLDPHNILNPGVILNDNKKIHIENIKPIPTVEAVVDTCIECGFCESVCPTRNYTITPRQRIILRREQRLSLPETAAADIKKDEQFFSIDTCSVDGICQSACPVDINTGTLVKQLRSSQTSPITQKAAAVVANHYGMLSKPMRLATKLITPIHQTNGVRHPENVVANGMPAVVYLPSCPQRWSHTGTDIVCDLATLAGQELILPDTSTTMCCGQPFDSKGLYEASQITRNHTVEGLRRSGIGAHTAVLVDTSTCAVAYRADLEQHHWKVLSPVEWLFTHVLPFVNLKPLNTNIMLHIGCSQLKLSETEMYRTIVESIAGEGSVLVETGCCGMAGIHGVRYPSIPSTALRELHKRTTMEQCSHIVTTNTFCAAGIERFSGGIPTLTIFEMLVQAAPERNTTTFEKPDSST